MLPETKRKMYILTLGEFCATAVAILVTLSFLGVKVSIWSLIRNIIIADVVLLLLFFIVIKVFHGYERLYKFGMRPEE